MNNNNVPVHSTATLINASIAAMVISAVVLVAFVLPAEYNIDPSGLGAKLGLTKLAQAGEQRAESIAAPAVVAPELVKRNDSVEIEIPAGKGLEYKLIMEKHANMQYEWSTNGGEDLYFDFHGEPRGDTTGYFESFAITTSNNMKGSLTTPFAGLHGWYWKNSSSEPITVTLSIGGYYTIKG